MATNTFSRLCAFGLAVSLAAGVGGCSQKLESPALTVGDVSPDLFCGDKLPQTVTITGDGFAPLPTKTLEGNTQLLLPKVELVAAKAFDSGDTPTPRVVVPDDPANPAASKLRFIDEKKLTIDVTKGLIAPGVYDVQVTNPDGVSTATWPLALALVPPPQITGFDKDVNALACLAEGDQDRKLVGKWFAKVDGKLPTVNIDGKPFTVKSMDGCNAISANVSQVRALQRDHLHHAEGEPDAGRVRRHRHQPGAGRLHVERGEDADRAAAVDHGAGPAVHVQRRQGQDTHPRG
jgi:hypothetical protein